MLKRNRLMCMVLPLFFVSPSTLKPFNNQAWQLIENKADNKEMVLKTDKLGLLINPVQEQFKKDKIELERKKVEELKLQKEKVIQEHKKEPQWQEFIVTFYTGLDEENSKYGAVNCRKLPLERGMVANNVLPYGTKIYLDNDYGIRTVSDTGGKNFNSSNRIDLFVAKYDNETKEQWRKRAESYGIKHIKGYIIK